MTSRNPPNAQRDRAAGLTEARIQVENARAEIFCAARYSAEVCKRIDDAFDLALSALAEATPGPWNDGPPNIPPGTDRYFIVAVRRKNGKIHTFPATFCNDYRLMNENPRTASGPGWSSRELEENEDATEAVSGWFDCESSEGDYDTVYRPLLSEGEQVIAWQPIPVYASPPLAPERAEDRRDAERLSAIAEFDLHVAFGEFVAQAIHEKHYHAAYHKQPPPKHAALKFEVETPEIHGSKLAALRAVVDAAIAAMQADKGGKS